MEINLSGWASLVQDVAASLQVLPPGLSNCLDPEMLNLLHRLEAVTQVKFCHLCYYPRTSFGCPPPMTPPISWSQIMEQTITSPPYKRPIGRADRVKAMLDLRGLVPWAPQMAPAIGQLPLLSQS